MPAVSGKQIAWIAGILEGEGSFSCKDNGTNAQIKLAMIDKDVVERAYKILGCNGTISEEVLKSGKTSYIIRLFGNEAIQWMMTIYCLMGERRKERIKSILILWKDYERQYKTICKHGHDIEIVGRNADGSCRECKRLASKEQDKRRRLDPIYKAKRKEETKRYWDKKGRKFDEQVQKIFDRVSEELRKEKLEG